MAGEVTVTPTPSDWIAANRLWYAHHRSRRWMRWLASGAMALAVFIAASDLALNDRAGSDAVVDALPVMFFALIVAGMPLLNRWLIPRQVRRMFAQRAAMADEATYQWDDDGLRASTRTGTTKQSWHELHRQLRDHASFVFLMTDNMMLMIPRRALTSAQDADLAATADHFGPPLR